MQKSLIYIGIAILVVIALVLGYKIYQQLGQTGPSLNPQIKNNQINPKTQTPSVQNSNTAQVIDLDAIFKQFPGDGATEQERVKFNDYLLSIGQEGDTLTIKNCQATPEVFRVKKGAEFKIVNQDSIDHILNLDKLSISAKANAITIAKTDDLAGAMGYYCDGVGPRIGILHVTP